MKNTNNVFHIKSKILIHFINPQLCNYAYNSYIPEFKEKTKRSRINLQKNNGNLIFTIESKDITAFRAALNEIISFGKIIEKSSQFT